MNCFECGAYIPVSYLNCPNCNSSTSGRREKENEEIEEPCSSVADDPIEAEIVDDDIEIPTKKDTRACPYCAEIIKLEAIICRFCRVNLKTGRLVLKEQEKDSEFSDFLKYGCGFIIALPFIILLFFIILFRGCLMVDGV